MGIGIVMCGLNGTGKSTLGKALAEKLKFHFIDNEELYFPRTDPSYIYASSRTREEVEKLLFSEIKAGYKVEICGVNTAKLPLLSNEEKEELSSLPPVSWRSCVPCATALPLSQREG